MKSVRWMWQGLLVAGAIASSGWGGAIAIPTVAQAPVIQSPAAPQRAQSVRLLHEVNLSQTLYQNTPCPVYFPAQVISPNSQQLAISSYSHERSCAPEGPNSSLTLWNLQTGRQSAQLLQGRATEAFSYQGQPQVPSEEALMIVGDIAYSVAYTPDSRQVVAGRSNGMIQVWNAETGASVRTLQGHRYAVHAIAISPDNRILASASFDQTLKLWDLRTGQLLHTFSLQPSTTAPYELVFSPDGRRLVSATGANKIQLWDVQNKRLIRTFIDQEVYAANPLPLMFSPDGRTLATGDSDHSIKLWNTETGVRVLTLRGHQADVRSLGFSPDGKLLASNSEDNTVRFWDLERHQPIRTLSNVNFTGQFLLNPISQGRLAFSPDGRTLATSAMLPPAEGENHPRHGMKLWDVASGQMIEAIAGVSTFSFSPDNQRLITNGEALRIWQYQPRTAP